MIVNTTAAHLTFPQYRKATRYFQKSSVLESFSSPLVIRLTHLRVNSRRRSLRPAPSLFGIDGRRRACGVKQDVFLSGGGLLVDLRPPDAVQVQLFLDRHRCC